MKTTGTEKKMDDKMYQEIWKMNNPEKKKKNERSKNKIATKK